MNLSAVLPPTYSTRRERRKRDIDGNAHSVKVLVDPRSEIFRVAALFYDEQINITVPCHRALGGGPKEYDLLRMSNLDYAPDYFVQGVLVEFGHKPTSLSFTVAPG